MQPYLLFLSLLEVVLRLLLLEVNAREHRNIGDSILEHCAVRVRLGGEPGDGGELGAVAEAREGVEHHELENVLLGNGKDALDLGVGYRVAEALGVVNGVRYAGRQLGRDVELERRVIGKVERVHLLRPKKMASLALRCWPVGQTH